MNVKFVVVNAKSDTLSIYFHDVFHFLLGASHCELLPRFISFNTKYIICNTKSIISNTKSDTTAAKFIVFDTKYLVFDTKYLVFDTQFLVLNTKFIIVLNSLDVWWLRRYVISSSSTCNQTRNQTRHQTRNVPGLSTAGMYYNTLLVKSHRRLLGDRQLARLYERKYQSAVYTCRRLIDH